MNKKICSLLMTVLLIFSMPLFSYTGLAVSTTVRYIDSQASVTSKAEPNDKLVETKDEKAAVPTAHIIVFALGILAAVGILSYIFVSNKKRQIVQNDEEDDDF